MSSINVQVNRNNNIISVGINSTGPQGQSAYETWLSLGNTGTKQDFIDSQFDEPARVLNENIRKQNELTRIENENARIEAENIRQQQENLRQQEFETNEVTRQTNETIRMSNEEARQEADVLRGQTVEAIEQHYAPRLTTVEGQINSLEANKANKTQENWINATLSNGWTGTLEYAKNDLNIVSVRFNLTAGTVAEYTQFSFLPNGYVPSLRKYIVVGGTKNGVLFFLDSNGGQLKLVPSNGLVTGDICSGYFSFYAG